MDSPDRYAISKDDELTVSEAVADGKELARLAELSYMETGRALSAAGRLAEAVFAAAEAADDPDEVIQEVLAGLIMHGSIEYDQRLVAIRVMLGRITGRQPFLYARTKK